MPLIFTGNTAWYTSSARYAAVAAWGTAQAVAVGALRRQLTTPAVNNERVFICITAGTTHATTEPTWIVTRGAKQTTDNGVIWMEATGLPALCGDLTNCPTWTIGAKSTSPSLGHVIKDAAGTHIFICTTSGAAGTGAEPTWNTGALGNTTVDASATWTYIGTSFGAWASPHARFANANATFWGDTGTRFYIGDDHAATQASSISWVINGTLAVPIDVLCVSVSGSLPPVSADLRTTATETQTASAATFSISGYMRICYGISFISTGGTDAIAAGAQNRTQYYENCIFSAKSLVVGGNGAAVELNNCTWKPRFTTSIVECQGRVLWRGAASAIDVSIATPTSLLGPPNASGVAVLRGIDLTPLSTKTLSAGFAANQMTLMTIEDCKLPASITIVNPANILDGSSSLQLLRSDSSGNNYRSELWNFDGTLKTETTVIRTGGTTENGTGLSWNVTTNAGPNYGEPFEAFRIGTWNSVISADVTATVYGIINAAAVPTNNELWLHVDYLGVSGSPLGSSKATKMVDLLAAPAALTGDSVSAWDSIATARANTHAYSVGDIMAVASNAGRLFFCTTAGTSAGSEPGGFASCIDGASVTDSGAVFRAGCRFSMAVVLTSPQPQIAGNIYASVRAAKWSTTYYIDPTLKLT